ncbi:MAG TPA: hypothetical protein VG389_03375 [Myxococcota bacterium]|jgi:hypothetical protein|nr:hypothetical protein [Myxococcota bacterium]
MPDPARSPRRPAGAQPGTAVLDPGPPPGADLDCKCCEPPSPLVLRPDLGRLSDGSAEYAMCVLHQPEPTVYKNRGDGEYVIAAGLKLSARGEVVDAAGNVVARVATDAYQRLSTVDDDDEGPQDRGGASRSAPAPELRGGSQPGAIHVDLTQDDFYLGS